MNKVNLFLNTLENDSKNKYLVIEKFVLTKSNKNILSDGSESFDTILSFLSDVTEFIFDNYKSLLDWLATTEIVIDKVVYKTRQNNIRYLQSLYKDNKDIKKLITYQEVKNFRIPVITGLQVDLNTYVLKLANNNFYSNLIDELLHLREISEIILDNNGFTKDKYNNLVLDLDNLNNRIKVNNGLVKQIKDDLNIITNANSVSDTKPLSKLVKSLSDLEKVTEEVIKIGKLFTVEKIERLDKYYKYTNEKVEDMLSVMETEKSSSFTHDGKSIAVLSKYIHSVAELLSFTSMKFFYYTLLVDTNVAIQLALKEYKDTKDPNSVENILTSFVTGIENAIESMLSIFKNK